MKNNESVILLSKDAMCYEYLPCYGNKYWCGKTPNMDQLAEKGTIYTRYYTAAPSSAMAYLSMFTGRFSYEMKSQTYETVNKYPGKTLFDKAYDLGFDCHIIWDQTWMPTAYVHSRCYGDNTTIHPLEELRQGVGAHNPHEGYLIPDDEKCIATLEKIEDEIKKITESRKAVFLWIHLPHVINGRVCYGGDIDIFDKAVGIVRNYFNDDNIFISADHGNMNGFRGKLCYGFDVNEPAIRIPLISPRFNNCRVCDTLCCNVDLFSIIFERKVPNREFIYSDSAYYAQPKRKLAILSGKFKYIFNKLNSSEELYDLEWDPHEKFNLINDTFYDLDRNNHAPARELFFYDDWDSLPEARKKFRQAKDSIWRDVTKKQKFHNSMPKIVKIVYFFLKERFTGK